MKIWEDGYIGKMRNVGNESKLLPTFLLVCS